MVGTVAKSKRKVRSSVRANKLTAGTIFSDARAASWGFRIEDVRLGAYTWDMAREAGSNKRQASKSRQVNAIQAAIDYGIDVTMLIENMGRSYEERIRRHQIALDTAEKLRKARHL
jgi:hypothetical protein